MLEQVPYLNTNVVDYNNARTVVCNVTYSAGPYLRITRQAPGIWEATQCVIHIMRIIPGSY